MWKEGGVVKNRGITAIFTIILLAFYITIILFTFFAVLHIDKVNNFATALVFEIIGFVLLVFFILVNIFGSKVKVGYLASLIGTTVFYTVILDVINLGLVRTMPHNLFFLVNLIVLFIYCLISVPIYIMGIK